MDSFNTRFSIKTRYKSFYRINDLDLIIIRIENLVNANIVPEIGNKELDSIKTE